MSDEKDAPAPKKRPNVDPDFVRELAALLDETGLTEIEVEDTGTRVRVARQAVAVAHYAGAPIPATGAAQVQDTKPSPRGTIVMSPMVGTAYLGPAPGAAPFVRPGDNVVDGQTIVIIEAMKTMNHVPSGVAGRVVEIYVQDGQPVEFGEPLMLID